MKENEFWQEVIGLRAFSDGVRKSTIMSTLAFFKVLNPAVTVEAIDWNAALLVASLVSVDATERAQDGALRIAQGCVQDKAATDEQKDAAAYLLRRLGNQRAARLASDKDLLPPISSDAYSGPLSLDLMKRTMQMSIDLGGHSTLVNDFQRRFWSAANEFQWVSLSAPTSAGKSYIVKRWVSSRIALHQSYRAVYLVPTRALIDEVSRDLQHELGSSVSLITLPWDTRVGELDHEVYVLTQERLHVLLQRKPDLRFDLIFVDEAQKLSDGSRGILLQRVLDDVTSRQDPQVIFASPLTSNPGLLLEGVQAPSMHLTSESVTVNQTLLYVNQKPQKPMSWDMKVVIEGEAIALGEFELPAKPIPRSKRLPLVAVSLGKSHSGNVVYANGAADAEKIAGQIYEALGAERDISQTPAVAHLVELIERTIHPRYQLAQFLKRGVAFHYGNMPLLLREEVESLFRDGTITYLVCTSTLLEGVNLPCQNLFVKAPKKGNNQPMKPADFWNLAGRAGRWGVEFQGNIICVDTDDGSWESVPSSRVRQPIRRATDDATQRFDRLLAYIAAGTPVKDSQAEPTLESLFAILAATKRRGATLDGLRWLTLEAAERHDLSTFVDSALMGVDMPSNVLEKHAGISPLSIQRLHDHFIDSGQSKESFELAPPESNDALDSYIRALSIINEYLGGGFTAVPGRHFSLALLFVDWMRGRPLSLLIANRLSYMRRSGRQFKLPNEIRQVLTDVEQFARFQGPLYLACYADTLATAMPTNESLPDIAMMMELGVSRTTELSMMSIGMSRTSAVALSEHIIEDELDPVECIAWIEDHDLEAIGLPALVVAEITRAVDRSRRAQQ